MSDTVVFIRQVVALTRANLKCRYRKTLAGFFWVVLHPLIAFGAQALVFDQFLKIDVKNYLLFLVSGLVPWIFISQTLEMSASVFIVSGQMIKSYTPSPLIYLAAQVLDNLINFIAGFALALLPVWFLTDGISWRIFLLPIPIAVLSCGVFGLAWLLALSQIFFRDTRFLISFIMQICFFLTPIFYTQNFVPESMRWMVRINPFQYLILPFQILIHDFNFWKFIESMASAASVSLLILSMAAMVWSRKRSLVYFYV